LKALSSETFNVKVIPQKKQIEVSVGDNWDLKVVENLLTQKGKLEFYATYNHQRLSELLGGGNHLFLLLNALDAPKTNTKIGYTSIANRDKVNEYLKTIGLKDKCRFAWDQTPENGEICLYALQIESPKGALFTGSDIEIAKFNQDKNPKYNSIEMNFKQTAIATWADFTKRNIDNAIAIVLDDNVIYSPVVRSVIDRGSCQFTGGFTDAEIKYMAIVINNGELPVSFTVVK
jgi:preprotein translocase subunit SecD